MRQILDFLKRLFGLGEAEAAPKVRLRGKAPEGKVIGREWHFRRGAGCLKGQKRVPPRRADSSPAPLGEGLPAENCPGERSRWGRFPGDRLRRGHR